MNKIILKMNEKWYNLIKQKLIFTKRKLMNIEYLKYFAELAKVQHYGKAAKILNISQPGLSHAIKTLEEEYGIPLFQREGRNVSLSSYGKRINEGCG